MGAVRGRDQGRAATARRGAPGAALVLLLNELVAASLAVAAVRGRLEKVEHLAAALSRCAPEEVEIAVDYLTVACRRGASASPGR